MKRQRIKPARVLVTSSNPEKVRLYCYKTEPVKKEPITELEKFETGVIAALNEFKQSRRK